MFQNGCPKKALKKENNKIRYLYQRLKGLILHVLVQKTLKLTLNPLRALQNYSKTNRTFLREALIEFRCAVASLKF